MQSASTHEFRAIGEADLPACVGVFLEVFNGPPWSEAWERDAVAERLGDCFRTPGFSGWVAETPQGMAAFAIGYVEPYNRERHYFLKEMCVHPASQRKGVGRRLMARLTGDLTAAGVHRVYLLTARDGPAEAFYRHCGFYVSPKMLLMGRRLRQ